jgi:hypothetical protein
LGFFLFFLTGDVCELSSFTRDCSFSSCLEVFSSRSILPTTRRPLLFFFSASIGESNLFLFSTSVAFDNSSSTAFSGSEVSTTSIFSSSGTTSSSFDVEVAIDSGVCSTAFLSSSSAVFSARFLLNSAIFL